MSSLSDVMSEKDLNYLRDVLGDLLNQLGVFRKTVMRETRQWSDFFAVFKLPPSGGVQQRCIGNLNHYWANYLIIALSVFSIRILFAPFLLFSLFFMILFIVYFIFYIGEIQVTKDITLKGWTKQIACWTTCFIFLGITRALEHILWSIIFIALLLGSHMVFRPRSVTASSDSSTELNLHGLNWNVSSNSGQDPENPLVTEEELFLNSYSGSNNPAVRRRH